MNWTCWVQSGPSPSASVGLLFPPPFHMPRTAKGLEPNASAVCTEQIFLAEWAANVNCDEVPCWGEEVKSSMQRCNLGEEGLGFLCKLLWKVSAHKGFLLPSCCTEWLTPNGYFCNSSFFRTRKQRKPALLTDTHTRTLQQSWAENLFQIFPRVRPEPGLLIRNLGWTQTRSGWE